MRRRVLIALLALSTLAAPATAGADAFDDLFKEYKETGTIAGCKHTAKELETARGQVPNDIEQYAPDFPEALEAALSKHSRGQCDDEAKAKADGAAAAPAAGADATPPAGTDAAAQEQPAATPAPAPAADPAAAAGATPQPTPGPAPAAGAADDAIPVAARTSDDGADDAPAALVLLLVLSALLLLGAAAWGAARWWAYEPPWLVRARHATGEAGWRTSAAWAEFRDWVRLGR